MKRDMDLVRKILLAIEAVEYGLAPNIEVADYTDEEIGYHSVLLGEAGLAVVCDVTHVSSNTPKAIPLRLTWEGHEFVDSARENQRWDTAKAMINKIGGASMQIWVTLLTELAKNNLSL